MRRGASVGACFFLKDGKDEAGADDRQKPNELGLQDLLAALEHLAAEDANGEPNLESDEASNDGADGNFEKTHDERR